MAITNCVPDVRPRITRRCKHTGNVWLCVSAVTEGSVEVTSPRNSPPITLLNPLSKKGHFRGEQGGFTPSAVFTLEDLQLHAHSPLAVDSLCSPDSGSCVEETFKQASPQRPPPESRTHRIARPQNNSLKTPCDVFVKRISQRFNLEKSHLETGGGEGTTTVLHILTAVKTQTT